MVTMFRHRGSDSVHRRVLAAFATLFFVAGVALTTTAPALASTVDSAKSREKPIVVLVPGFFNSLTQRVGVGEWLPYFSQAVLETIQGRDLQTYTVDTLSPVGSIASNGDVVLEYLSRVVEENPDRRLLVIAHSAGGLYAMQALTKRPDLPIDTVVTIATPYRGVEFIQNLTSNVPGIEWLADFLDLDSLRQFEFKTMSGILEKMRVPDSVRWVTIAGEKPACQVFNCTSTVYLSWILSITQCLMQHPSDGVVTVGSALGEKLELRHLAGDAFEPERWSDFNFALEHWEMTGDYRAFSALGIIDIGRIRSEQKRLYTELLTRLNL